ncbi:hypothetical protein [Lysinibacillus sphaericus]|uniref:hypothetical protein n=1 Tax=Lysinibacillus sphaericus TaxID=1421 RepID=UPI001CC1503D|nr:hypothetical protein [Lysinibacillus sphaericus]
MSSVRKRSANVASATGFYLCESATTATTKRLAGTEINPLFCRTAFTFVIHKIYKIFTLSLIGVAGYSTLSTEKREKSTFLKLISRAFSGFE